MWECERLEEGETENRREESVRRRGREDGEGEGVRKRERERESVFPARVGE